MHPLLHLIATRPQLLAEHAQAYADLLADELPRTTAAWKRRALLQALALLALLAATVLAGVALMLWSTLVPGPAPFPWLLLLVPLVPLVAAIACLVAARTPQRQGRSELQQQFSADLAMLRDAAAAP
jgi:peptidoglycan/LPS O-acetylase OafA/YrhL